MIATYALGSFNENFFKEAAMLMAVAAGRGYLQGYATVIFTLPYLLFAAPAGWLADRFPKRDVIIGVKLLEAAAMTMGAYGLYTGHWMLILTMATIMATQATILSPAVNSLIPELFPAGYVTRANAILKVIVMSAILMGVATAGIALGKGGSKAPGGGFTVMVIAVIATFTGSLVSFGVPWFPATAPQERFPWKGPLVTLRNLWELRKDRLFSLVIATDVFIWTMGSLEIQIANKMGLQQFQYGERLTGILVVAELGGFGAGGFLSSRLAVGSSWYRILPPSAAALAVALGVAPVVPLLATSAQTSALLVVLACTGICGGMLLVPCESFVQVRPKPSRRGAVIAAVNFAIFSGILVSGPAANIMNASFLPTTSLGVLGALSLVVSLLLFHAFGKVKE
jgi:acyl-[acyl-carrier-protein]-phospholipid O-acyltransferase/long-chain-fatty-acid--[acyl-carrier-protein] ligase